MKWLVSILALLALSLFMPAAYAPVAFAFAGSAETVWCVCGVPGQNVAQAVTSGSLLVLMITANGDYTSYTISDTQGNTWTRQAFSTSVGTQLSLTIYTAFALATGTDTITAGIASAAYKLIFLEYEGVISISSAAQKNAFMSISAQGSDTLSVTGPLGTTWNRVGQFASKVRDLMAPPTTCNTLGWNDGSVTDYSSGCTFVTPPVDGYYNSEAGHSIQLTDTPSDSIGTWLGDCDTETCYFAHTALGLRTAPPDTPLLIALRNSLGGGTFGGLMVFFFLFTLVAFPLLYFTRVKTDGGDTMTFMFPIEFLVPIAAALLIGLFSLGLIPIWIPMLLILVIGYLFMQRRDTGLGA